MIKSLHPQTICLPFGNYAHGVCVDKPDSIVMTSGQLGISKDGAIPESLEDQAIVCFNNIEAILAEADMGMEHIFQLRTFVTERAYFAPYMLIRDQFLDERAIASTLIIVSGFTKPEFKIEIEALAAR